VARRGVVDQATRVFHLEVAARARSIESVISSTRADLAFLASAPAFFTLETALESTDPREVRWRRLGAEGALLLFLRGHPEIRHLGVASSRQNRLVQAGRRGGVPVLWKSEEVPVHPAGAIVAGFPFQSEPGPAGAPARMGRLEAEIDPAELLSRGRAPTDSPRVCDLTDASGRTLANEMPERESSREIGERTVSPIRAEGWSADSPWKLTCAQSQETLAGLIEPLAARYRMTLVLNLAVMALALLLGSFAIQQARRRERLEARSREEGRVREVERQLFHSERLGTVGRLAAGMAHEINNPLEGMSNYLSLARESLQRGDPTSAQRQLDRVAEGLERTASVVRQVLQHADPARAPHSALDLNAALMQSVEFVRSRREFAGIRFALDLAEPAPMVSGSQVLLGQLFLNLLLNACEAQPGGGEVSVSTRSGPDGVTLEIADRGPGLPEQDAARIFEPFYSTKESTGLGLSVCHAIVRQHGGEIQVENRRGGGALFRLSFPTSAPLPAPAPAR
ncbi:MAG TPA: ATP-binding protein, partial [Patescibacteria group bacterium]|nr:ATP-binding protein [Patescibacteria group bacterium]